MGEKERERERERERETERQRQREREREEEFKSTVIHNFRGCSHSIYLTILKTF